MEAAEVIGDAAVLPVGDWAGAAVYRQNVMPTIEHKSLVAFSFLNFIVIPVVEACCRPKCSTRKS